jgi:hypothetical protein
VADLSHHDAFPQTRWSLVLAAQGKVDARAQGALSELCSIYWPPIDAFDSEPKLVSLDEAPVRVSVIHPTTLEEHLGLIYKRRKDASNLSYSFELSSGLAAWTAAGSGDLEEISVIDKGDGTETVTVRATSPVSDFVRRFIRLKIVRISG